jgi:hypothetical protein
MQKIEAVKTSDGRLFETNEEAAKHEIEVAAPACIEKLWSEYISKLLDPCDRSVKDFVIATAEDLNRITATVKRAKQALGPARAQFAPKREGHTYCKHCDRPVHQHESQDGKLFCREEA